MLLWWTKYAECCDWVSAERCSVIIFASISLLLARGPHQSGLTPDLAINKGIMQSWSLTAFLEHQSNCDHAVISMRYLNSAIISLSIIASSSQGCKAAIEVIRHPAQCTSTQHCSKLSIDRLWQTLLSPGCEVLTFWQRQPPSREVQARLRGSGSLVAASTNQRPGLRSRDPRGPIRGQSLTDTPSRGD